MRLLVATPLYPPEPGGPATYAKLLESELPKEGIQTALAKFSSVRKLPKLVRHLAYFLTLLRAGRDADVILALDPVSTGLPAALAARLLRKPFVVKVVGDYAWEQGRQRFGVTSTLDVFVRERQHASMVILFQRVQTWVARQATAVIVPSAYLKGIVRAWGIPDEHVSVIFNAVPNESSGTIPAGSNVPRPRIVSVGRLVPWKGVGGLIDAMVEVRATIPTASLVIAGEGPDRRSLESYAQARLGDAATFTGAIEHAEVLALFREADVFVLNSTYEGLSHLLIEAQMIGTPTIATNVGGNAEVITDMKDGILVPSGDRTALAEAIIRLSQDTELAARFHAAAKESSTRFSVQATAVATAVLLRSLV